MANRVLCAVLLVAIACSLVQAGPVVTAIRLLAVLLNTAVVILLLRGLLGGAR